jgi:pimeloyl-ACP methyl ester carboxylesterase
VAVASEQVSDGLRAGAWTPPEGSDARYARFPKHRRVVVDDGTPIAYGVVSPTGRRKARTDVIFANGWSCSDVYWTGILPGMVGHRHRAIIPDTRGHGASGLPRPPGRGARNLTNDDLSIARLAADLVAVLDDAGSERAIIAGHSMGVQTALEVYRLAPERVAGLVLVAGSYENPLHTFYGTPILEAVFPFGRALMATLPEAIIPIWRTIGNKQSGYYGAKLAGGLGPNATADALHPYLLHLAAADPAVMVRLMDSMRRHSAADLLRRIEAPTLILAAGHDRFTPPSCSQHMFEQIPTAEIQWFDQAGHTLPIEEPDALVAAIDEWATRRVDASAAKR